MTLQPSSASSTSDPGASAAGRLLLSALFVVALAMLAVGDTGRIPALSVVGVLGAACFGVGGAPLVLSRRPTLATRLGVACLLGLSLLALVGSVMVLAPWWHPLPVAVGLGGVALVLHAAGLWRALRDLGRVSRLGERWRAAWGPLDRASAPSLVCAVVGSGFWLAGALALGHIVPGNGGFLAKISPLWFAGVLLCVAAIALARRAREPVAIFAVASLVLALTLTPALVYAMPEVQTAGKHIEVVQAILRAHHLDVANGVYDAYSGFFSAIAWVCDLGRIRDSLGIATYWPCIVGVLGLVELRWLLGSLVASRYRIWAAATLAVLANTVEENYFSPQSVGIVLGIAVFALVLDDGPGALGARTRDALLVLAGCALAVTHELSPFIVAGVLIVLAIARRGQPRWAAATMLVPAGAWAIFNHSVLSSFVSLSDLLNLSNFAPPKLGTAPGLRRAVLSIDSFDALVIGMLVLIALAFVGWFRNRRERWAWACIVSPAVGLVFTAVNPYNNEGIFRAILFSLPWLAVLAAHAPGARPGRWVVAAFTVVTLGLLVSFSAATFELDGFTVIRPADLTALREFEVQAPPGSGYVDLGFSEVPFAVATSRDPDQYLNWQTLLTGKHAFVGPPTLRTLALLTTRFTAYVRTKSGKGPHALYALWSPTSPIYSVDYGLMSRANALAWRNVMLRNPRWTLVYHSAGSYLFRYKSSASS